MNKYVCFLFSLATLICPSVNASDILLNEALSNMGAFDAQKWAYVLRTTGDEARVERHDPVSEYPWTSVSLEGKRPSARQIERYQDEKAAELVEFQKSSPDEEVYRLDVKQMIDLPSVTRIHDSKAHTVYEFTPIVEGAGEAMSKVLKGKLSINKNRRFVEIFEFENTESFSPMIAVEVSSMHTKIVFSEISEGVFAPYSISSRMEAVAMKFKKIRQLDQTNFEYLGLLDSD